MQQPRDNQFLEEVTLSENEMTEDLQASEIKSKSQVKRELLALQDLGKELVSLPAGQLAKLPLTETIMRAIGDARDMKKGALKRQLQYIGKLMRSEDVESVQVKLEQLRQPHEDNVAHFHKLEGWRDALIAEDDSVLDDLMSECPGIETQHVRQLARNARKEQQQGKAPRSARQLFQYLKSCCEQERS